MSGQLSREPWLQQQGPEALGRLRLAACGLFAVRCKLAAAVCAHEPGQQAAVAQLEVLWDAHRPHVMALLQVGV
jgi:hypothetical protein